jgi:hypothetical protein
MSKIIHLSSFVILVLIVVSIEIDLKNILVKMSYAGKTAELTCVLSDEYINPTSIIPMPQEIEMLSCDSVVIDNTWKIYTDLFEKDKFSADYLQQKTFEKTNIDLEVLDISELSDNKRIIIGNSKENKILKQIAKDNEINVNTLSNKFDQGYFLIIKPDEILIFSNSNQGAFYGMISLLWLLNENNQQIILPNTKITDWPDFEIRGFYGAGDFEMGNGEIINTKTDAEKWIEYMTYHKLNFWTHKQSNIY